MASSVQSLLKSGLENFNSNQLDSAIQCFHQVLEQEPQHADATHFLGLIAHRNKDYQKAVEYINKAIQIKPTEGAYQLNLAKILVEAKALTEAQTIFERLLEQAPDHLDILINLSNLYHQQQNFKSALDVLARAKSIDPNNIMVLFNSACIYISLHQLEDAIDYLNRVIAIDAKNIKALFYLGTVLHLQGKYQAASVQFEAAIQEKDSIVEVLLHAAVNYQAMGSYDDALKYLNKAYDLNKNDVDVIYNLSEVYQLLKIHDKALYYAEKAKQLAPDNSKVLNKYVYLQLLTLSWQGLEDNVQTLHLEAKKEIDASLKTGITPLISLVTSDDPAFMQAVSQNYIEQLSTNLPTPYTHTRSKKKVLNIGYCSCDFYNHPIGLMLDDLFAFHDRKKFKIVGYDLHPVPDQHRKVIEVSCDEFVDLSTLNFQDAAEKIYQDEIDILIDLSGFTGHAKPQLFLQQPAPIQCHYLGNTMTQGNDKMQYYITKQSDALASLAPYFNEKMLLLPDTLIAFNKSKRPKPLKSKSSYGLPDKEFVFASFNNLYRLNAAHFDIWMKLLHEVPNSVLWLQSDEEVVKDNIIAEAKARNISADRFVFSKAENISENWHIMHADLVLDTYPFLGFTTTLLSLWAGVPVISMTGDDTRCKLRTQLAESAGVPELVTKSSDDYFVLAKILATEPKSLKVIQAKIEKHHAKAPLYNKKRLIKHLESGYKAMYENYLNDVYEDIIVG